MEEPLVPGSAPDDFEKSYLEVWGSNQDKPKRSDLEFCSILYGPKNLNQERCSSLLPGNTLCLPSNCSLSPIRRDSFVSELDVPMDLEDSVFLSPGKSVRILPPTTATSEQKLPEAALPLSRLLCLSSCVLALPLLTLGVTLALDLPSMAASSLTAAIFLSALVLIAALLSVFARWDIFEVKI